MRGGRRGGRGSLDELDYQVPTFEWLKLFKYLPSVPLFTVTMLFQIISCLSPYLLAVIQGELTTVMLDTSSVTGLEFYESVDVVSTKLFFTYVFLFVATLVQDFVRTTFDPEFQKFLNRKLYDSLLNQDAVFYDGKLSGVLLSRVEEDVSTAASSFTGRLTTFITASVQFISGLYLSLNASWQVSLIMMACMPVYALIQFFGKKIIDKLLIEHDKKKCVGKC